MKKILLAILITAFAVQAFAQNGVIRELTGDVEIRRAGAADFVPASAGDTVNLNTIVSTGFRSTAIVEIGSSTITVRPLTRLSLAEIQTSADTENVNVNLQAGRVRVDVNPPAGTRANFTVQSPSATASVRGTSFEFDTVNVSVAEGKVIFGGNAGPSAMVNTGYQTFIGTDGTAENPITVVTSTFMPPAPAGVNETVFIPAVNTTGDLDIEIIYR